MRFFLFFLIALFGVVASVFPSASRAQVNAAPTVSGVTIALASGMDASAVSSLTTNENADIRVYVHGTYTDDNGCGDVATSGTVRMTLYRSWVDNGPTCTANRAYCFRSTSIGYTSNINFGNSCTGPEDLTGDFEFSVLLPFYVDPTDVGQFADQNWIASVTAVDNALGEGANTATMEINTLSSLNIANSIQFGTVVLGVVHANENFVVTVTNTGNNNELDVGVAGTPMFCSGGTIPVANIGYVTTTYTPLASAYTSLTGSLTSSNVNILKGTEANSVSQMNVYWDLTVPETGVGGACNGTLTLTAMP